MPRARSLPAIVLMACAAILSWLAGIGFAADFPAIALESTSNADLDKALRASLNAPELERSRAGTDQQGSWKPLVEAERHRLEKLMRGRGYRDARVDVSGYSDGDAPQKVMFKPHPGPLYRVGMIEVDGVGGLSQAVRDDLSRQLATATGEPVSGEVLATLEDEILWRVRSASYPFVHIADRQMQSMPGRHLAMVRMTVDPGAVATFGTVTYSGLVVLKEQDLIRLQPFKPGDAYDPLVLDRFRDALIAHPSIRTARVLSADGVDGNGQVQLKAEIGEEQLRVGDAAGGYPNGVLAVASAIAVLAFRQISVASLRPGRTHWPWWLEAAAMVLLAAAFFFGAQRLVLLAVPG
ncbi:Outer membrane protein/protective antigen OMA87 [Aminobacter niigataensis]|nr:Outer membrane protein/protective antigen OMA87 [Aminobacter niigataensis]